MSSPPNSFQIRSWHNGDFKPALFPVECRVDTTLDPTTGLYDLTWMNGNGKERLMSLPWTSNPGGGGDFSGKNITIYGQLDGHLTALMPLMLVNVVITIDAEGACNGTLVLLESPSLTQNPGIFVAQADPGQTYAYRRSA